MFSVGEYVVHGNDGVCKVEAVEPMSGSGSDRIYYTLVPVYTTGSKLFVPTDSTKVITRAVMSKNEVKKLMDEWEDIELLSVENDKKREEVYKAALRSCDCRQWVKLIKTSYQRNQMRLKNGKKVTTSDERYLHMAQESLFGEVAIPLEMTRGEAEDYFIGKVESKKKKDKKSKSAKK
ncbi:MAG: CarD family transcriptional regulator [Eubacterium sp.]|nr:CarD family transcriptional regulator [Eubacterium sp.]